MALFALRQGGVRALPLCAALALTACGTAPPAVAPMPSPMHAALNALCADTARHAPPPRAATLAFAAQREHLAWGAQTIDDAGRLVRSGASEAEDTPRAFGGPAPWQRVLGYWRAVDPDSDRLPYVVRYGALQRADRGALQSALAQLAAPPQFPEPAMGSDAPPLPGLAPDTLRALQVAVDRVAVVDTPWSAAFVSALAREAGLAADEFMFSEAHADYAGAAARAGAMDTAGLATRHAMRACDIEATPPRAGDLVCQTRGGDAAPDGFEPVLGALAARAADGDALPMHCDIVAAVDDDGFDAIGGNVLQSVTLRRLAFARDGSGVLDPSYLTRRCGDGDGAESGRAGCVDRHMSRAPWSLLLQWR